jgi:exopolyphosphatase/guanosine-5'-triphosphate,3'-diphosphate pyrophosphatase
LGEADRPTLAPARAGELSQAQLEACEAVIALSNWLPEHVRQVRRIAGWLYDDLRPYHGLGDEERVLLLAAALLHDVGYPTDPARHHKVSARIVRSHLAAPFTPEQVDLIALLARYHRKAVPKLKHRRYAALAAEQQRRLCWLGGILRVADGLDRAHGAAVRAVQVGLLDARIEVRAEGASDEDLDGAMRKRDLLERTLGMAVVVRASEGVRL